MAFLVDALVESARELLHRVDQYLLPFSVHFETLSEGLCLTLDQPLASEYHEILDLVIVDVHFASCLVVRLQDGSFLLVDRFLC